MSTETPDVYQAELSRVKGTRSSLRQSIEMARIAGIIPLDTIATSTPADLGNKMRYWRILVVSLQSLSTTEWNGQESAKFLFEARDIIGNYYYHPLAWEIAKNLKQDSEGSEYQMAAEMCRDEAKYYEKSAGLIGSKALLQKAVESFDEAIDLSKPDSSAYALAIMERETLHHAFGQTIDFEKLTSAYNRLVILSPQVGGWDRLAAVSWIYAQDSLILGHADAARKGLSFLKIATSQLGKNWTEYPKKEVIKRLLTISRKLTAQGLSESLFLHS